MTTKAWHWTSDTLRNGAPIPEDGVTLVHDGPIQMCRSGLHASRRVIDALQHAPGPTVHRVSITGVEAEAKDKLVAKRRTILWRVDATDILRIFARLCALDVIQLWDAPSVVRDYLETGDEALRAVARSESTPAPPFNRRSPRTAAWHATRVFPGEAAHIAARAAARTATRAVAAFHGDADKLQDKQNRRLTAMIRAQKPNTNR